LIFENYKTDICSQKEKVGKPMWKKKKKPFQTGGRSKNGDARKRARFEGRVLEKGQGSTEQGSGVLRQGDRGPGKRKNVNP